MCFHQGKNDRASRDARFSYTFSTLLIVFAASFCAAVVTWA